MRILARALVLGCCLALLAGAMPTRAQQTAAAEYLEDFAIPNGYFFTQAAPGQRGAGYRVANEAGIPFWDEFQRHGGLARLGYPTSRRFMWREQVVQLFQFGALRWRGGAGRSHVIPPAQVGRPPAYAIRRGQPPASRGRAAV